MDTKNWSELASLLAEGLVFDWMDGNLEGTPIIGLDAALQAIMASPRPFI